MNRIQIAIPGKGTDDHTIGAQIPEPGNLPCHLFKFPLVIQKITESGTNQNIGRNPQFPYLCKQMLRRGGSADDQIGAQLPGVSLKGVDGKSINIDNIKAATIIVAFIDPECDDCNIARLRLSTNVALNSIIDGEKLALVCIYPGPYSKEWAAEASTSSDKWIVAASEDADERFDLRQMPTIYVLDADKKIVAKNVRAEDILNMVNP